MSFWTQVFGTVEVKPLGYSEHAREFVLKTVLDYLPPVTGSEGPMRINAIMSEYKTSYSSTDDFGQDRDSRHLRGQATAFLVTVYGSLRDRMFEQTKGEFDAWLETLARRVLVTDVMVRVSSDCGDVAKYEDASPYREMFEEPSYQRDGFGSMSDVQRCPNWRYDFMPDLDGVGNWCETLPYLVPGGAEALQELDEIGGHAFADED